MIQQKEGTCLGARLHQLLVVASAPHGHDAVHLCAHLEAPKLLQIFLGMLALDEAAHGLDKLGGQAFRCGHVLFYVAQLFRRFRARRHRGRRLGGGEERDAAPAAIGPFQMERSKERLVRNLTHEGNIFKGHASIVRWKSVFPTDRELQIDWEEGK